MNGFVVFHISHVLVQKTDVDNPIKIYKRIPKNLCSWLNSNFEKSNLKNLHSLMPEKNLIASIKNEKHIY